MSYKRLLLIAILALVALNWEKWSRWVLMYESGKEVAKPASNSVHGNEYHRYHRLYIHSIGTTGNFSAESY